MRFFSIIFSCYIKDRISNFLFRLETIQKSKKIISMGRHEFDKTNHRNYLTKLQQNYHDTLQFGRLNPIKFVRFFQQILQTTMYTNFLANEQVPFDNISLYLNNQSFIPSFNDLSHEERRKNDIIRLNANIQKMSQQEIINEQMRDSKSQFDSCKEDQQQESMQVQENRRNLRKPKAHSKKNLSKKNRFYAKNYREKRKQKFKMLEQQNSFLKQKVDDLTFRLKQAQLVINKLKHSTQPYSVPNLQSTRESLLKQISSIIDNQYEQIDKLVQLEKQLKKLNAFDGKHKRDFLNYFMSELLENLLNDMSFYFIDSLIDEKGRWKADWSQDRTLDCEICEMVGISDFQIIKGILNQIPLFSLEHLRNFKTMWKKLYQDYLNIVSQGHFIGSLCRHIFQSDNKQKNKRRVLGSLKLELYFQRIKYRKDMRQLRQSWFEGLKYQSSNFKKQVIAKN